jgi:hypothetical protein
MKMREINVSARLAQAAAVFIVISIVSLLILSKASPMVWEDHFQIGQNLRTTGALTIGDVPSIIRPPGFPGFVAATLWIGDAISRSKDAASPRSLEHDRRIVVSAHGILLGTMAAALFFWASRGSGFAVAAGIAAAATLNPYMLALANLASYHLLFVVLLTFATLGLALFRNASQPSSMGAVAAGLLWGLTSLVKPVTLIVPIFIAPLLLMRWPLRTAVKSAIMIGVGMILVVGPYVARNYWITGQPIVTAQGSFAFWGTSVERADPNQPFIVWQPIWWKYGMPIFSRVTGSAEYSEPLMNAYALQLNAEFSKEARENITAAPGIYLHNVVQNFISFNLDTMEFWNKFLVAHNKQLVHMLTEIWIISLLALSAMGAIWGCVRNDGDAITVTTVYLCIVIGHSVSFATELYTVSKFPLIILGFALLAMRLETHRYGMLSRSMACGMASLALVISVLAA